MAFDIDVDIEARCDECGSRLHEGNSFYCEHCYNKTKVLKADNERLRSIIARLTSDDPDFKLPKPVYLCPLIETLYKEKEAA